MLEIYAGGCVDWCRYSCLHLNTKKTKDIIFDFRTGNNSHQQITIYGEVIEVGDDHKYLGTIIDFEWTDI